MVDVYHYWGNDLQWNARGDLVPVDGTVKGQQRVLRRLLTNPAQRGVRGDYLWHPTYGAGLPRFIGRNLHVPAIQALIRSQILMESAVAPDPAPNITVQQIAGGVFVEIQYVDAPTRKPVTLTFNVTQ